MRETGCWLGGVGGVAHDSFGPPALQTVDIWVCSLYFEVGSVTVSPYNYSSLIIPSASTLDSWVSKWVA